MSNKTESNPQNNTDANKGDAIVKPRDAASLILYRSVAGQIELLLGRRPTKSRFMPDVWVYPGGAVDPADSRATPATPLNREFTSKLAVGNSHARARAFGMAAVRETFEETGLRITRAGDPGSVDDESYRALQERKESADLSVLRYIGRAITPTHRPIRFHARFFATCADSLNQEVKGNGELIDLEWFTVKQTEDLEMRVVTRYMLEQLTEMLNSDDPHWIGNTMFTQKNKKPYIKQT